MINPARPSEAQPCAVLPTKTTEPCADYQLFRRAIVERVDEAWARIYQNYSPMVFGWVINHPCFWKTGEDADYFANRAFEKLWLALAPEKFDLFPDLSALLKYLQTCVHSVIIDHVRKVNRCVPTVSTGNEDLAADETVSAVERVLEEIWWAEVWERIRRRVSPREEKVLFYRFLCGLKPRQIYKQFPREFSSVDEIYNTLQNVLDRLRRDFELKQYI